MTPASQTRVMNGNALAKQWLNMLAEALRARPTSLPTPRLLAVQIGDDPASNVYLNIKTRRARHVGMLADVVKLPADSSPQQVMDAVQVACDNPLIHGVIVQLPLPPHINRNDVLAAVHPNKDVDGLHPLNAGALAVNHNPAFIPCTPLAVMRMLHTADVPLVGSRVVIIGSSRLVGIPLSHLLLQEHATVTLAHAASAQLPDIAANAHVLIAAAGSPHLITRSWIAPNSCVIDVGVSRIRTPNGKHQLLGDVLPDAAINHASIFSPSPGGVGPLTVHALLLNTLIAANRASRLPDLQDAFLVEPTSPNAIPAT